MFKIGETIVHPDEGICTVEDIRKEEFVKGQSQEYYVLRPAETEMVVYVPLAQDRVKLRYPMTEQQVYALAEQAATASPVWSDNEHERQARLTAALRSGDPVRWMRLVQDVRAERMRRQADNKKLRFTDEQALQQAERLLQQEIAMVTGKSVRI